MCPKIFDALVLDKMNDSVNYLHRPIDNPNFFRTIKQRSMKSMLASSTQKQSIKQVNEAASLFCSRQLIY